MVLTPLRVRKLVALFCVTPVTLAPKGALMTVEPEPEPELVRVPVLFTAVVERVRPPAMALSLLRMRLPVPVTPPETVKSWEPLALVLVRVVALICQSDL